MRLSPADATSVSFGVVLRENRLDVIIIPSLFSVVSFIRSTPCRAALTRGCQSGVVLVWDFVRLSPVDANSVSLVF